MGLWQALLELFSFNGLKLQKTNILRNYLEDIKTKLKHLEDINESKYFNKHEGWLLCSISVY
jgi:hypothetical protein